MIKPFNSLVVFCLIMLLAACNIAPLPLEENLETAAIQSLVLTPSVLTVNADSQTGMFVNAFIKLGDTLEMGLQTPPAGITATFTPRPSTGTFRSFLMTLNVSPTVPTGTYTLRIFGKTNGRKLERVSANLALTVSSATANPSFKIIPVPAPANLELARGTNTSQDVLVSRMKGFNQAITLSLNSSGTALSGVSASAIILSATALSGRLTVSASTTATPVFQKIQTKIEAVGGTLIRQVNVNLTVRMPAGELDPSFANDGTLDQMGIQNISLQLNNKLITLRRSGSSLIVERYNEDASPDSAFGTSGSTSLDIAAFGNPSVVDMVVDANNRILILVQEAGTLLKKLTLFRLKANGRVDTAFGAGTGRLNTPLDSAFSARALVVQPDGKAVVGLTKFNFTASIIMRISNDGIGLDSGFASQGQLLLADFGATLAIALQKDGKMVLAGKKTGATKAAMARVLPEGTLDNSFGSAGFVEVDLSNFTDETFDKVAIDNTNQIIAAGVKGIFVFMARVDSQGVLDPTFSGDGFLSRNNNSNSLGFNPSQLRALVLQDDGKQLLTLSNQDSNATDFLWRQKTNGAFDPGFSGDGKIELGLLFGNESIDMKTVKDSKGRIIILGALAIVRIAL